MADAFVYHGRHDIQRLTLSIPLPPVPNATCPLLQFAGGFDSESMAAFAQMRSKSLVNPPPPPPPTASSPSISTHAPASDIPTSYPTPPPPPPPPPSASEPKVGVPHGVAMGTASRAEEEKGGNGEGMSKEKSVETAGGKPPAIESGEMGK